MRETDRHPERQTANRAKSSKGYRARKTDADGERECSEIHPGAPNIKVGQR